MQAPTLYLLFVTMTAVLTPLVIVHGVIRNRPLWPVLFMLAPVAIASAMFWIFTINHGRTVVQMALAEPMRSMWSLWVDVWPVALLSSLASAGLALVALAVELYRKRRWSQTASVMGAGLLLSAFAFAAAFFNFPTA